MTTEPPDRDFALAAVRVRPGRLSVEFDGAEHRVEPRVMELLVFLAERADRTISREQLREELWDAYVTDDAIHRAVWKLRRALAGHADLVETVPKRGYRLTARPESIDSETPVADSAVAPPASGKLGRIIRFSGTALTGLLVLAALWIGVRDTAAPAAAGDSGAADPAAEFVPFSAMSGYESQPEIDREGAVVVFANFAKEGEDAFQWDLWERSLEGGPARRLTRTPGHEMSPAVSPDGTRIAFVRTTDTACGVHVLDRARGEVTDAGLDCGVSRGPADCCRRVEWRDDERLLVTRRDRHDAPSRVYEFEMGSGAVRTLTDPAAQSDGDMDFALSHDGASLALVRRRAPEMADLWILELETGSLTRLTSAGYSISGLAWTPDDSRIVFGWSPTGTTSLWSVSAVGGRPRPLRTVGMNASGPALADGLLLYEEWTSQINVVRVDLTSGVGERLAASTRWDWRASGAPGDDRIAFTTNREGREAVWLMDGQDGAARLLADLDAAVASAPAWSPDGERLVIAAAGKGGLDLAMIDATTGVVDWLNTDASDDREPVFAHDGSSILFSSNRTGGWEIHELDVRSGQVRRWTHSGGTAARPADDGIWFVRPAAPGLWRQRSPTEEAELVDPAFRPSAASDWTVVDGAVYFTRRDAAFTSWLSRFDPAAPPAVDLLKLEGPDGIQELYSGAGLWISPDGRYALVSSVDQSHSDLWLGRPGSSWR